MWHDQRCATSVTPATSDSRRMPREARALLMSRTRRWSKPEMAGPETAASAAGVDVGAVAIKGAPAAAETSSARRRTGRKGDIWDFLLLGRTGFRADASQGPPLSVKTPRRSRGDGVVRFPLGNGRLTAACSSGA